MSALFLLALLPERFPPPLRPRLIVELQPLHGRKGLMPPGASGEEASRPQFEHLLGKARAAGNLRGDQLLASCQQNFNQAFLQPLSHAEIAALRDFLRGNDAVVGYGQGIPKRSALRDLLPAEAGSPLLSRDGSVSAPSARIF